MHILFANGNEMNTQECFNTVYDLKQKIQKEYGYHTVCIQIFRKSIEDKGTATPLSCHNTLQYNDTLRIFIVNKDSQESKYMECEEIKYLHEKIKLEQDEINQNRYMLEKHQEELNNRKILLENRCCHPNRVRIIDLYERTYLCKDCGWENTVGI